MCGRFANSETIPVQAARFAAREAPGCQEWKPTYNAAPTQKHPVVIQDFSSRRIGLMQWGWKPDFMKGKLLVNARGEEAIGKRTFQDALAKRRCIVPATLFYEWLERTDGPNLPHAFARQDRNLFGIAGLWQPVGEGVERIGQFILLTVQANAVVAPVHHRMAAILRPDDEACWLDPATSAEGAHQLLQPLAPEGMTAWRVSLAVNSVKRTDSDLVTPVESA